MREEINKFIQKNVICGRRVNVKTLYHLYFYNLFPFQHKFGDISTDLLRDCLYPMEIG
jgi:hypothetical protein